jgi:hypothetical protein
MKEIKYLADGRQLIYQESFWTGRKKIFIDGEQIERINKKYYQFNNHSWLLKGNFIMGAHLEYNGSKIVLVDKLNVFQYMMVLLPVIALAFLGGVIGALIGAFSTYFLAATFRSIKNILLQILLFAVTSVAAYYIWLTFAFLLLGN